MNELEFVILVGHGGVPTDFSKKDLSKLKKLEGERQAQKIYKKSEQELELDEKIRQWPRNHKTDPYKFGVEAMAEKLRVLLGKKMLIVAYNEFCWPSLESAIKQAVDEGSKSIQILTTMLTPGGYHSEIEIPEIVKEMKKEYPKIDIHYLWPYNINRVAELFLAQIQLAGRAISTSS